MSDKLVSNKNMKFVFLYAIGSILIVAGHCKDGGINLLFNLFPIYSFHLGLFMFCSGYFYKSKNENELTKYAWKKFKNLVLPMFLWNIIYGIFTQITRKNGFTIGKDFTLYNLTIAPIINGHQFMYNMCFWYIPSLFLIQMITCIVRKTLSKIIRVNEYCFFIAYLLLGVLGVYLSNKGLNKNWILLVVRTLYFFPFFGLGILYNRKLEKIDKLNNYAYFSIIMIIQLIIIYINEEAPSFTPSWCDDFPSNVVLPFIVGFLAIAFWLRLARILEPITQNSKIINTIASNAYAIMAHQFFAFFVIKWLFSISNRFLSIFLDFNFYDFKSNIWYYYTPKNNDVYLIIYVIAGIFIPIIINNILNFVKTKLRIMLRKRKNNYERKIVNI